MLKIKDFLYLGMYIFSKGSLSFAAEDGTDDLSPTNQRVKFLFDE